MKGDTSDTYGNDVLLCNFNNVNFFMLRNVNFNFNKKVF
jgi:hypothetical protein